MRKLCIEHFRSSCKFGIPVRPCSSQQNSFPNTYSKINLRESRTVGGFVNFYTSESVSLGFSVQTTQLFYISCDVVIEIINVDKNNKCVCCVVLTVSFSTVILYCLILVLVCRINVLIKFFLPNVANVHYIYAYG